MLATLPSSLFSYYYCYHYDSVFSVEESSPPTVFFFFFCGGRVYMWRRPQLNGCLTCATLIAIEKSFFFFHGPATCNRSVLWGAIILAVLLLLLLLLIAGSILKVLGYAVRVCCWSKCLTTPLRRLCVFGLIALQCCFFSFSSSSPFAFSTDKSNRKWCSKCHVTDMRTTATEKIASRVAAYFTVLEHQKQLSIITCLFSVAIVLLLFVCLLPPTERRGHFLQFSAKLANRRGAGFHTHKKGVYQQTRELHYGRLLPQLISFSLNTCGFQRECVRRSAPSVPPRPAFLAEYSASFCLFFLERRWQV